MPYQDLKINRDYKYGYPYGAIEGPVLTVKRGKYVGPRLHIESSYLESSVSALNESENKLHYTYSIRRMWTTAIDKDRPNTVSLGKCDQEFIYKLILSFIKETN